VERAKELVRNLSFPLAIGPGPWAMGYGLLASGCGLVAYNQDFLIDGLF
jgi:hypothetical protein